MKLIVGIDFGTSTTCVKYKWEGSDPINSIKDANGVTDIIPTVIFRPEAENAKPIYGKMAESQRFGGAGGEYITNFKMDLISSDPAAVERSKSLIREFMAYLYSCFQNQTLGMDTSDCVVYVSYPAKWPSSLAKFMKTAVSEAGFPGGEAHGVFEPQAAMQNALKQHYAQIQSNGLLASDKPLNIMMLDMGAGTSDIFIFQLRLEIKNGKVIPVDIQKTTAYPSVDDPSLCGGREIDELLQELIRDHLQKTLGLNEEQLIDAINVNGAKQWKEEYLSFCLKSNIIVGELPSPTQTWLLAFKPQNTCTTDKYDAALNKFTINRASFEDRTKEHWKALYKMIESAVAFHKSKYGIGAEDMDLILLTGGHSAWYTVPKLFNGEGIAGQIAIDHTVDGKEIKSTHFTKIENEPWRILSDALPHESVARGLVLSHEGIDVPATASNNVWIRMKVKDKESDLIKVVSIGEPLPIIKKEGQFEILFKDCRIDHIYDIDIYVLTGRTIETADVWTSHHRFNNLGGAIFGNLLGVGIPIIFGIDYKFELNYNFKAYVDGTVHFESILKKDFKDPIEIKF